MAKGKIPDGWGMINGGDQGPPPNDPDDPGPQDDDADPGWRDGLLVTDKGKIRATFGNVLHILRFHPCLAGRLSYDSRALQPIWTSPPPWRDETGPVREADAGELALWVQRELRVGVSLSSCADAILSESYQRPIDRVADYLRALEWDGTERLDTWISLYLGAEQCGYTTSVGRAWCISAVARALGPGCKVDTMLVLEGPQGVGKSSALRAIAGEELFAELAIDVGDKDSWLAIHGPWIVEWSELAGFGRREAEAIKSFLSRQVDRMRPPYGRVTGNFPRMVVFTGSTNESTYLGDPTGGRRYWPIRVGDIDVRGLAEVRDQLWAEAVRAYRLKEAWWLGPGSEDAAKEEQDQRLEVDPWEDLVAEIIDTPGYADRRTVSAVEIAEKIGLSGAAITAAHSRRIGKILDRLGWTRGQETRGRKHKNRVFYRPANGTREFNFEED